MKKLTYLLILSIAVTFAACTPATRPAADQAWEQAEYAVAAEIYRKVYGKAESKEERAELAFLTAESYRKNNEYRQAAVWYGKAERLGYSSPEAFYYHGQMLKSLEDYEEAIVKFQAMKEKFPADERAVQEIEISEKALKWMEEESRWVVDNFRQANSGENDWGPAFMNDRTLVFTSDRPDATGKKDYGWTLLGYTDLFTMEQGRGRRNDRWEDPQLLEGEINTMYNEGAATFNERGTIMYFTQCNGASGKDSTCRIYMARKKGKGYGEPEVLPFNADSFLQFKYGHPSLSPDGDRLYFASNRPGGEGGHDIWVSFYTRRGRTWSEPVNLGPGINTEEDELFPYAYDDTTLYFASKGWPGMGGLDLFRTYGQGSEWTEPENLKAPMNSGGDDFAITWNEERGGGFFSSNRPRSRNDDIYQFTLTPLVFTLSGLVYNQKTGEVVPDAVVTLSSSTSTEPVVDTTDATGSYSFELEPETDYVVMASKEKFFNSKEEFVSTVGLKVSTDLYQDLYIDPYVTVITLEGIYYDLNKANIRADAANVLDSLVDVLERNPYLVVELGSHTDCRDTREYNYKLSQRRADSAVAYLVNRGIAKPRLYAQGYGEDSLINMCACEGAPPPSECTEAMHQANRRTTFRILATDYNPDNQTSETIQKKKDAGELDYLFDGSEAEEELEEPQAPARPGMGNTPESGEKRRVIRRPGEPAPNQDKPRIVRPGDPQYEKEDGGDNR